MEEFLAQLSNVKWNSGYNVTISTHTKNYKEDWWIEVTKRKSF